MRTKAVACALVATVGLLTLVESAQGQLFRRFRRRRQRETQVVQQQPAPIVVEEVQQVPQPQRQQPTERQESQQKTKSDTGYQYSLALAPPPIPEPQKTLEQLEAELVERIAQRVLKKLQQVRIDDQAPPLSLPIEEQPAVAPQPPAEEFTELYRAQLLVNKRCTACHRHDGSDDDGLDLRDLSKVQPLQSLAAIKKTYHGDMPKKGEPLTDDEMQTLLAWLVSQ